MEQLGRYEIIQELGRGAMGVVYKARDPNIGRLVAIKVISPEAGMDPKRAKDLMDRFQREARAAGRLSHPNIITIYDAATVENQAYLVMEFIEGKDLESLLSGGHPFSVQEVVSIGNQVAQALDYAHEYKIVHRDIKPANIMLMASGQVKVADFGIARTAESSLTRTGLAVGTPSYMSPEQVAGQTVDGRSDQFSLGATLYELLSGEKAFPGDTISTVVYRIMQENPIPLRQANPNVSEIVDVVIRKALAKNPAERYPRVADFGRDLLAAASGAAPAVAARAASAGETLFDQPQGGLLGAATQTPVPLLTADQTVVSLPTTPAPSPKPTKSRWPILAGAGAGVVALGLGLFFVLRPTAPPAPPAPVAVPAPAPVAPAPKPEPPPPAEEKPKLKPPQLDELVTAKDVRADGRPVGPSTQFSASDPKVAVVATGTNLTEQRRVRVKWFDPDGKEIPSSGVPKLVMDGKGGWRAWAGLNLAGGAKPGLWKVQVALGDDIDMALSFTVTQPVEVAKPAAPAPVEVAKAPTPAPPPAAAVRPGAIQKRGKDEAEMVYVPAGMFTMGDTHGDGEPAEKPSSKVTLTAFWVDRVAVTFEQFAKFVQAANYKPQGNWEQHRSRGGSHPVVNVSWNDALAYCRWADKRLATEAEWEYAARGTDGRKYPWGDQWDANRARFRGNKGNETSAVVGSYPSGASPFGILDMAGNVWQWTASLEKPYPYVASDGREDIRAPGSRVTRGGSWLGDSVFLRTSARDFLSPTSKNDKLGFRCTQNP